MGARPPTTLDSLLVHRVATIEDITGYDGPLLPLLEEDPTAGKIMETLRERGSLETFTNFTEGQIQDLVQLLAPHLAKGKGRGPKPKSSLADSLICYLIWAKLANEYDVLAKTLGMKATRFEDNVNRTRVLLNQALKERWWSNRARPTVRAASRWPHGALLIDCHTTLCYRPKGRFEDAKTYWDGKNKCYGLKSEVAVSSTPPYHCLFVAPHRPGSVHDYQIHKSVYAHYLEYLLKLPEEAAALPADAGERFWSALLDKGYVGPQNDTPDLRRIVPFKAPATHLQQAFNEAQSRDRVHVECFFGRLCNLWGVASGIYRWDHKHFDMDLENLCLLTNEKTQANQLAQLDYDFYQRFLNIRLQEQLARDDKRKQAEERAKHVKRLKLRNTIATVYNS